MQTTAMQLPDGRHFAASRRVAWRIVETARSWMNLLRDARRPHGLPAFSDHLWCDIGLADLDGMDAAERAVRQAGNSARTRELRWK